MNRRIAAFVLVGLLCGSAQATIDGSDGQADRNVSLYASLDRAVLRVGERATFTVEAIVSNADRAEHGAVEAAFRAIDLPAAINGMWALERRGRIETRAGARSIVLLRRYVIRALASGRADIRPLRMNVAGRPRIATTPVRVWVGGAGAGPNESAESIARIRVVHRIGNRTVSVVGSGFLLSDSTLITAYHVVAGAHSVHAQWGSGHRMALRRAVLLDPERDVAVFAVSPRSVRRSGARVLHLSESDVAADDVVYVAGSARGDLGLRSGRVFGASESSSDREIVTNTPVLSGESGSPLLDERGYVLGMVASARTADSDPNVPPDPICLATRLDDIVARLRRPGPALPLHVAMALSRSDPSAAARTASFMLSVSVRGNRSSEAWADSLVSLSRADDASPRLLFLVGSALMSANVRHDEAADALRRANEAGHLPAAYMLGYHRLNERRYREASEIFDRLRQSEPYEGLALYGLAQAEVSRGGYGEAAPVVRKLLRRSPSFAPGRFLLGLIELHEGESDNAEALLTSLRPNAGWHGALSIAIETEAFRPMGLPRLPRAEMVWADTSAD